MKKVIFQCLILLVLCQAAYGKDDRQMITIDKAFIASRSDIFQITSVGKKNQIMSFITWSFPFFYKHISTRALITDNNGNELAVLPLHYAKTKSENVEVLIFEFSKEHLQTNSILQFSFHENGGEILYILPFKNIIPKKTFIE